MYSAFGREDVPFAHPETLILNSITPVLSKKFTEKTVSGLRRKRLFQVSGSRFQGKEERTDIILLFFACNVKLET
jgi:hypothetical protein